MADAPTCSPEGCPLPVASRDGLDAPLLGGHPRPRAVGAALPRLPDLAVGAGVDLPPLPLASTSGCEQVAPTRPSSTPGSGSGTRSTGRSPTPAPTSSCWSSCPTPATSAWSATSSATRWQPFEIGDRGRSRLRGPRRRRAALHARPVGAGAVAPVSRGRGAPKMRRGLSTSIVSICSSVTPRSCSAGITSLWMCR